MNLPSDIHLVTIYVFAQPHVIVAEAVVHHVNYLCNCV
jgi:hypothetical protein